jgi:hypothetical protein
VRKRKKSKESFFQEDEKNVISLDPNFMMESYLSNINKNIQTIKNHCRFLYSLMGHIRFYSYSVLWKLCEAYEQYAPLVS